MGSVPIFSAEASLTGADEFPMIIGDRINERLCLAPMGRRLTRRQRLPQLVAEACAEDSCRDPGSLVLLGVL